jgi:hypothetical protein
MRLVDQLAKISDQNSERIDVYWFGGELKRLSYFLPRDISVYDPPGIMKYVVPPLGCSQGRLSQPFSSGKRVTLLCLKEEADLLSARRFEALRSCCPENLNAERCRSRLEIDRVRNPAREKQDCAIRSARAISRLLFSTEIIPIA